MSNTPSGYVPQEYLDRLARLTNARAYKARMEELLNPQRDERILEIGCGTGNDAIATAASIERKVIAIDSDPEMIQEARRRTNTENVYVDLSIQDAHSLAFQADSFNGIRADRVLQHTELPPDAITEMYRVLLPGGRVVLFEPDWATLIVASLDPDFWTNVVQTGFPRQIKNPWIGRDLYSLVHMAGFIDIQIFPIVAVFTDYDEASSIFRFSNLIEAAIEGGMSKALVEDSMSFLSSLWKDKMFFASLTGYIVYGVKST